MLGETNTYMEMFKNLSGVITEVELSTLEKVTKEGAEWWKSKKEEQEKLGDNQDPAFTWSELKEKVLLIKCIYI